MKHCLIDSDYVCNEQSASVGKTGFENKDPRVLKKISLTSITQDFEAPSCAIGEIFPRAAAFSLSSFTFFLYFYTKLILTPCSIIFLPIHSDARSLRQTATQVSTPTSTQKLVQYAGSGPTRDFNVDNGVLISYPSFQKTPLPHKRAGILYNPVTSCCNTVITYIPFSLPPLPARIHQDLLE